MKWLWYTSSIFTILLILLNNSKSNSFGNMGIQNNFFSYTKSTQKNIQVVTIVFGLVFLLITAILASNI